MHAADAAVVAGAKNLIYDEQNLSDYTYSTFVNNWDAGFRALVESTTPVISKRNVSDGDRVAKQYIIKNLSSNGALTDS